MNQIKLETSEDFAPHLCQRCDDVMRLIGSESDPVEAKTDLLTYCCVTCEEFFVQPIKNGQRTRD